MSLELARTRCFQAERNLPSSANERTDGRTDGRPLIAPPGQARLGAAMARFRRGYQPNRRDKKARHRGRASWKGRVLLSATRIVYEGKDPSAEVGPQVLPGIGREPFHPSVLHMLRYIAAGVHVIISHLKPAFVTVRDLH